MVAFADLSFLKRLPLNHFQWLPSPLESPFGRHFLSCVTMEILRMRCQIWLLLLKHSFSFRLRASTSERLFKVLTFPKEVSLIVTTCHVSVSMARTNQKPWSAMWYWAIPPVDRSHAFGWPLTFRYQVHQRSSSQPWRPSGGVEGWYSAIPRGPLGCILYIPVLGRKSNVSPFISASSTRVLSVSDEAERRKGRC